MEVGQESGKAPDERILRDFGCERVFSAAQGVFVAEDVVQYLRPGDVLAVADLSRLGADIAQFIQLVEQLHSAGVRVCVVGTEVGPDTALGATFAQSCAILAKFARAQSTQGSAQGRKRSRGRPAALSPASKTRAQMLLRSGQASVAQVARILKVSSTTLYRHFPRTRKAIKTSAKSKAEHWR